MTLETIVDAAAWVVSAGLGAGTVLLVEGVRHRHRIRASGADSIAAVAMGEITFVNSHLAASAVLLSEADTARIMAYLEDKLGEEDREAAASPHQKDAERLMRAQLEASSRAERPPLRPRPARAERPLAYRFERARSRLRSRATREGLSIVRVASEPMTAAQPFIDGVGHAFSFGLIPLNSSPIRSIEEVFSDARADLEAAVLRARRSGIIPPHVSGSN